MSTKIGKFDFSDNQLKKFLQVHFCLDPEIVL